MPPKWAHKKRPKIQPKQQKRIGSVCNPVTVCSLYSIALIGHISLVSTPNYDSFEALNSWLPKLQNHDMPKKFSVSDPNFGSKLTSLCCHALYIVPHFNSELQSHLNHWIHDFLSFKSICGLPYKTTETSPNFEFNLTSLFNHGSQNKNF